MFFVLFFKLVLFSFIRSNFFKGKILFMFRGNLSKVVPNTLMIIYGIVITAAEI